MESKSICSTNTATILACQNIARSFKENIYELSRIRNEWDPEFATSLKIWVDDTIEKYYEDCKEQLNDPKFRSWHELMIGALKCLGILRASMKVDFKEDKVFLKDFLKKHGYSDFFSDAKNGDHLSMYNLLKTFSNNLNEETKIKILKKGVNEPLLERILEYAKEINAYKDCFELMESNYGVNTYGKKEVEEIYGTIKDICRISIAYYQYDPVNRDKFNFYRVLRNL